jgi:ATP adenylyltransferase
VTPAQPPEENPAAPPNPYPGQPDGFERLWTPHRMAYIDGYERPATGDPAECPFCLAPGRPDEESLIVGRGRTAYVVLNLFPYNPGHLLVCPYRHVADVTALDAGELAELGQLAARAVRILNRTAQPAGFNLGINQGSVAGAGIGAHLHMHVVPRWSGDANFFPIVARTRALPELLGDTRRRLADAWGGEEGTDGTPSSDDPAKGPTCSA